MSNWNLQAGKRYTIRFKHWKTGEELEVTGEVPTTINNPKSDRIVVLKSKGCYEDIIKETIVSVQGWKQSENTQ